MFGFDGDLAALHTGKQTLAGLPCSVTTGMDTYEGKSMCKIKWLNPPGGGVAKPLDEAKVQSIIGKLTAKAKAIAKTVPKKPATPTPSAASDPATQSSAQLPNQDDVPF